MAKWPRYSIRTFYSISLLIAVVFVAIVATNSPARRMAVAFWLHRFGASHVAFDDNGSIDWISCNKPELISSVFSQSYGARTLDLSGARFLNCDLQFVRKFRNLALLDLSSSDCKDDTLNTIPNDSTLLILRIANTEISDSSLEKLLALKNLRSIDVSRTKLTSDAIGALRKKGVVVLADQD